MKSWATLAVTVLVALGGAASGQTLPAPEVGPAAVQPGGEVAGRFWVEAEYLLWWMKGAHVPPLVTTGPPGTPLGQAGVLGANETAVLFGGSEVGGGDHSGGRFAIGAWLDDEQMFGVEGGAFFLESKSANFSASSTGNPILARPFIDATTNRPASEIIAFPGLASGSVSAHASSTGLLGADALLRAILCCGCDYRIDVFGGYRFLRLADHVGLREDVVSTSPAGPNFIRPGTTVSVTDQFDSLNEFHGLNLGLRGELYRGPWVLRGLASVAVGDNHQVVDVNGSTTVSVPGAPPPVTSAGGLLALQSNIGRHNRDQVAVIPECRVQLGYQLTSHLRAYAGYTFLYWGEVVRAGDQIDLTVNPSLLPPVAPPVSGPLRPAPRLENTTFWAQGIDLGLELRF